MLPFPNNPDQRRPSDELNGKLREAVDRVRAEPVPQPAVNRAVERARRLSPKRSRGFGGPRTRLVAAAALLLMATLALWGTGDGSGDGRSRVPVVVNTSGSTVVDEHREVATRWGEHSGRGEGWGKDADDKTWAGERPKSKPPTGRPDDGFLLDPSKADPRPVPGETRPTGSTLPEPARPRPPEIVTLPAVPAPPGNPHPEPVPGGGPAPQPGTSPPPAGPDRPSVKLPATDLPPDEEKDRVVKKLKEIELGLRLDADKFEKLRQTLGKDVLSEDEVTALRRAAQDKNRNEDTLKRLADVWGRLPEKERAESLADLTKGLSDDQGKAIRGYLSYLAAETAKTSENHKATLLAKLRETELDKVFDAKKLEEVRKAGSGSPVLGEALDDLGTVLTRGKEDKTDAKLKKFATNWGKVPAEEQQKAIADLTKGLPQAQKKMVEDYFAQLAKAAEAGKGPQVWKRNRGTPTVARVYVGDGNSLDLVSLQVSVTVEGCRARTLVDHVFRNPHDRQLEGTFEYPLPTAASPSYFAMFLGQTGDTVPARFARAGGAVPLPADALARLTPDQLVRQIDTTAWGRLQEARVVSKEKALETYEEVVRGRIDPALLEYSGGNTFSGRVFPIPAKGYNRVLIAYEETLPVSQGRQVYRFPLPDRKLTEMRFTLQAKASECKEPAFEPKDTKKEEGDYLRYTRVWENEEAEGDVVFAAAPADPRAQFVSGRHGENGPVHVYARLRPDLKAEQAKPFAEHAVFLLDTSLSEHPDRFALNMKLLRKVLESDAGLKHFNVMTFNVGAAWVEPKGWLPNTEAGRETAFGRLDGLVLEGATDVSAAFEKLLKPGFEIKAGTPLDCFLLSDGQLTWGDNEVQGLVAKLECRTRSPLRFHCYRLGLGAENAELFDALTRKGGGVFHCFGEADLAAAAKAHLSQCFQVEKVNFVGGPEANDVLVSGRRAAVYPGGELVVGARLAKAGKTTVVLEGTFQGKKHAEEFVLDAKDGGELASRAWGELAVASLLSLNDPSLDGLVTAYCQQFGIGSKVASFLVLENEADYKRFNLEEERGKTVSGDLGDYLQKAWDALGKPASAREVFEQLLHRIEPRVKLMAGANGPHVKKLMDLLKSEDFDLHADAPAGGLLKTKDVPASYLDSRSKDRQDVNPFLSEARRRADNGDADAAVRVLSSVVELHPGRSDALRLVGYRLLDLKQPGQAARLFAQVQRQRPFEPHSYRDLARSLEDAGMYGLAAVQYEIVLAGTWHNRFGQELQAVVREEYARMMQDAIRKNAVGKSLADHFGERLEKMADPQPASDVRVTISWNTDNTDVDLWVIEPDGTKCFYQHNRTKNGGELSQDQTQGYGPERYRIATAPKGTFTIWAHYYRDNPNLLGGETHVNVVVTRYAGTAREVSERHTVILRKNNDAVEVCKIKF